MFVCVGMGVCTYIYESVRVCVRMCTCVCVCMQQPEIGFKLFDQLGRHFYKSSPNHKQ